jgi:hypothetical protein
VRAKVIRKECKSRMECSSKNGIAIAAGSEAAIPRLPVALDLHHATLMPGS